MPKIKDMPNDLNEVLLNLYCLSREMPIHKFQNAALEQIKVLVPFDASMWGNDAEDVYWPPFAVVSVVTKITGVEVEAPGLNVMS